MVFSSVNDTVTAKDEVRLRDKPSQDSDATVIATLVNGETITRTGTSSSGWSRLVYNGQTVYAVTSYLTTDLTPKATENPTTGFNTKFTDCNDTVTPKEEVNLRNKPSVTDADSVVVATAKKGEFFTRTGYNTEVTGQGLYITADTLLCYKPAFYPINLKCQENYCEYYNH
ncbi:MAG: SH3 domain-containing protein [Lachnospira eligens]